MAKREPLFVSFCEITRNVRDRYLDSASFIKGKFNTTGVLSLGYTQALRPGVKATFGLALDTQKLTSQSGAAHKVSVDLSRIIKSWV